MNGERRRRTRDIIKKAGRPWRAVTGTLAAGVAAVAMVQGAAQTITPEAMERAALYSVLTVAPEETLPAHDSAATARAAPEEEVTHIEREDDPAPVSDVGAAGEGDDGVFPITHLDLSGSPEKGELLFSENETSYSPDLYSLLGASYPIEKESTPTVLILHTHATEAYSDGSGYYTGDTSFRSDDPSRSVIAVGDEIANELEAAGVRCIHCATLHDAQDFSHAYDRAAQSILGYLARFPEIQYVIDVHRDAIVRGDGEMVAPTVDTPQGRAAQVMLVMGTDAYGADHPRWRDNLNIACKLQSILNSEYDLARPINIRGASFNEQYRAGSMLLEVGSCANTLDEAKLAGRLFARALAKLIKK